MSFNFPYTCPEIDVQVEYFKDSILDHIQHFVDLDSLSNDQLRRMKRNIYEDFQSYYEDVRDTNVRMRTAAEDQLDSKDEEINDLVSQIRSLEERVEYLEEGIRDMSDEKRFT